MSIVLECLGLSPNEFFFSNNKPLYDGKKEYGVVKKDDNGNYHVIVGENINDRLSNRRDH